MPRILVISPNIPSSQAMGTNVRVAAIMRHLQAQGHMLDFLLAARRPPSRGDLASMQNLAARSAYIALQGQQLAGVTRGPLARACRMPKNPFERAWLAARRLVAPQNVQEQIQRVVDHARPDAILAVYAYTGALLTALPRAEQGGPIRILDSQDVMHERDASLRQAGVRPLFELDATEEAALLRQFDMVLAIQSREAESLRRLAPEVTVVNAPHAVAVKELTCDLPVVLFVGGKAPSNVQGICRFLKEGWPHVAAGHQTAVLKIVGQVGLEPSVKAAAVGLSRVQLVGPVPSLEACYAGAGVVICPLWAGSGLKIKVAEALAFGKPVVTTPVGADGLADGIGTAFLLAEQPADFVVPVLELLKAPARREQLAASAAEYAQAHFSAAAAFGEMDREMAKRFALRAQCSQLGMPKAA